VTVLTRGEALERVSALPTEAQARVRWNLQRRPSQIPPDGDWSTWLIMAGRGWGKTRVGAEWLAEQAYTCAGTRWAIVAATFADARDTCVEGQSGLLHALGGAVAAWNRSLGEVILHNGSRIKLFSAEEPERLRGPQFVGAWCDELGAWNYPAAWDQLQFGLRLGDHPRTVVTTTPRPTPLMVALASRDDGTVILTRGSTFENEKNLAPSALRELRERYEGTRLGRQELYAELLTDLPGALWQRTWWDQPKFRVSMPSDLERVVTAIDPAVTSSEDADETGIVSAGTSPARWCPECQEVDAPHFFVVADDSGRGLTPEQWCRRAVGAYYEHRADRVVAEVNNGGDLVEAVLRQVDRDVAYRKVNATRGKAVRAGPVAALYEQRRVHHVGDLSRLEDQLVSWTPEAPGSPDRMDALVWALTDLMERPRGRGEFASPVSHSLPKPPLQSRGF